MALNNRIFHLIAAMMIWVAGLWFSPANLMAAQTPGAAAQDDFEILASGPIHEAFAEAVALDPEPGMDASKEPPPLIAEVPPDQKPEGDVEWIPGYWAWDDERDGYIWVSGIWRVPPPGRQWVPGYWQRAGSEYQWVSGYWGAVADQQVQYLPEPPESVEVGPSSHPPSADHIWVPGCWVWQYGRYAWRPGYWAPADPDWIWVPAHYSWTPRGYIYVGGYWDYTIGHRGILFAPIFFPPHFHFGMGFVFSPGFVIGLHVFDDALFLRPRYSHYYFGDYYAPAYYRRGIYPWFSLHSRRIVYDPIYAHQRWNNRHDRQWESRLERTFSERRDRAELRPPRTYDRRSLSDTNIRSSQYGRIVTPLDRMERSTADTYKFKPLSQKERDRYTQQGKAVRTYQNERQQRENAPRRTEQAQPPEKTKPDNVRTGKSPVVDRTPERKQIQNKPPRKYEEPAANPNIEPLERRSRPSQNRIKDSNKEDDRMNDRNRQRSISSPRGSNDSGGAGQRRLRSEERPSRAER